MVDRRFTTGEIIGYLTAWAITCACWTAGDANAITIYVILFSPGALIFGAIGLAVGGRSWFVASAILGGIVQLLIILIPAMNAVR